MSKLYSKSQTVAGIYSHEAVYMTVREGSQYIRISERKLRDVIARNELKHVRFGSRVILRKQDLDSFLEGMVV